MIPIVDKYIHSAIDFDAQTSTIYYSDATHFRIMKKNLTELEPKIFLDNGIAHSEGIAIDWIGRNIYWTDNGLNVIHVASLEDSTQKKLLVSTGLTNVKSLVVHPQSG